MNLFAFMSLVEAAKNYPCIKKAWVEFLGEKPDPAIDCERQLFMLCKCLKSN
jgi:hypothetical protein